MKWISSFKYLPIGYGENIAYAENLTQRVSFENNVDGDRIRVRFTNRFGKNELRIKSATIGKDKAPFFVDIKELTVGGEKEITLAPGQEVMSDEIVYESWAGDRLVVSLFFADRQDIDSICCFWADGGAKVAAFMGDATNDVTADKKSFEILADFIRDDPNAYMMKMFTGFDTVQVLSDDDTKVVAAFGDSITHMSFYTNALQKRLYQNAFGRVCMINSGIGGNRLLADATFVKEAGKRLVFFGEAGVSRFERDVFELDEVDTVLVLIGINDIMHPIQLEGKESTTNAKDLIEGYKKIISMAHENGAEVFFGTIMPCGNEAYPKEWVSKFEEVRNEVNEWIRRGEMIDGFFDFDMELADSEKPGFMTAFYHIGDGLHPNTLGGEKMADCVDIKTILG
ncbi:MAG: hypothetical protein IJU77_11215 [Butyrivibrio sp.]|nr:hypothetical protein [Butyrivibrio sp.]